MARSKRRKSTKALIKPCECRQFWSITLNLDTEERSFVGRMHLVATKESSLFLFHALGKVLFNKSTLMFKGCPPMTENNVRDLLQGGARILMKTQKAQSRNLRNRKSYRHILSHGSEGCQRLMPT